MIKKVQLNEEQLKQVNGGDALEDAVKEMIKEQEEEQLNEQIDELEKLRALRASDDLNDTVDNLISILNNTFN